MRRTSGAPAPGEHGVALLAVLWMLAAAGTAAALGLAAARGGIATSRHRTDLVRARWMAEGCLAEFRARLEGAFTGAGFSTISATFAEPHDPWANPHSRIPEGCVITLAAPGDGPVDINSAPDAVLRALPGLGAEVAEVVLRERQWGRRIASLDGLIGLLPPDLRERVDPKYGELTLQVVFVPPAWVVTGHGLVSGRVISITMERWVRVADRVAVIRREIL